MNNFSDNRSTAKFTAEQASAVQMEIHAVLKSHYFSSSKRCQDFLNFVVRHALDGDCESLTERFIGAELFGRSIDYDTGADSIVRVRANDVRRRLTEYYANPAATSKVIIHLAAGSYIPEFEWPEPISDEFVNIDSADDPHSPSATPTATDEETQHQGHEGGPIVFAKKPNRWWMTGVLAIAVLAASFFIGWWMKGSSVNRQLYPWKSQPSMDALWSGLLASNRSTDVVLSDTSYLLQEEITDRSFTLDQYRDRTYLDHSDIHDLSPGVTSILNTIGPKSFGNSVEFRLAQRISSLDPLQRTVHVYNAREYTANLLTQDNTVLIGSEFSNPWEQLFADNLNFSESKQTNSLGIIINKHPLKGEQSVYTPSGTVGYCVVAFLPSLGANTNALLIEGSSSEATDAGGDFVMSEDKLAQFQQMVHLKKLPYFELLLKTSQVQATPISATIVAYRIHPR